MLDKADLFGIELKTQTVHLEQGDIIIKEFTTFAREQFELIAMKMKDGLSKNMKAKLIAMSCIKDNGNRYFGDDEIEKISELPASITEKIFNAILDINGMGDLEGN